MDKTQDARWYSVGYLLNSTASAFGTDPRTFTAAARSAGTNDPKKIGKFLLDTYGPRLNVNERAALQTATKTVVKRGGPLAFAGVGLPAVIPVYKSPRPTNPIKPPINFVTNTPPTYTPAGGAEKKINGSSTVTDYANAVNDVVSAALRGTRTVTVNPQTVNGGVGTNGPGDGVDVPEHSAIYRIANSDAALLVGLAAGGYFIWKHLIK